MHGTILQLPAVVRRPLARTGVLKTTAVALAVGVLAAAAIYQGYGIISVTERGHKLLIKWGFEYPPDCG